MRAFSIIGSAHVNDARLFDALEKALRTTRPDQLLLEMPDEAATSGQITGQKPEMSFAYRWAIAHDTPVRGHEPAGFSVLRSELTAARIEQLLEAMNQLLPKLTLRRTIDIFCGIDTPGHPDEVRLAAVLDELIDPQKAAARSHAIVRQIKSLAVAEGTILVICGGAHVPHIAEALPGSRIIRGDYFY